MSMLKACGSDEKVFSDDVFSALTYTGNGSTQTINNGIDLAGKGGLVWIKNRGAIGHHQLFDTARGAFKNIQTSTTQQEYNQSPNGVTSFLSNGFDVAGASTDWNTSANNYVGWTFRKSPRFFDVVTFTANNTANQRIGHSLGVAPGLIIIKATNTVEDWYVYHASLGRNAYMRLNTSGASATVANIWGTSDPTASDFGVSSSITNGTLPATYVAYIFAHDTSTDGIIQCGSFTTDGSGNATVNLGWESQFIITKCTSTTNQWEMYDSMRGMSVSSSTKRLYPNLSDAEDTKNGAYPNANGFSFPSGSMNNSATYIYMAIRRPNKPPATGTQVYNAIARTGTGAAATVSGVGFVPDLVINASRTNGVSYGMGFTFDRLRGAVLGLQTRTATSETSVLDSLTGFDTMDGFRVGVDSAYGYINSTSDSRINWCFKRAPGVFDIVCYTGTGSATTVAHGLGVVPELMIIKARNGVQNWNCWHKDFPDNHIVLNSSNGNGTPDFIGTNTNSIFDIINFTAASGSGVTYVAYLFASKPGISKVGSYTGGGNLLTYSEQFDNAAWVKAGVGITANATTAPDGTLTADKLVESATTGGHYIQMGATTATNIPLTFSFYVKAAEKTNILYIQIYDSSITSNLRISVDLATKSFVSSANTGTASLVSCAITLVDNGWFRVAISGIPASSDSGSLYACRISFLKNDNSNNTYTGDGTSGIYLWGAQLEQGSSATTYTPTTDVAPALKIDCGFTTGARFVLIKRTDAAGDWYVFSTATGIVAGNDPHLSLNTTAAEVTTDDSCDPTNEGIIVNQVAATNINVSGASYIYLALA